jgi:hypothetical protein
MAGRSRLTIRAPPYAVRNLSGQKGFDTSGKSPADFHHRKNFETRLRGNRPRVFSFELPESGGSRQHTILPRRALVARRHCVLPPELLLAGTRTPVNCLCTKYAEIILDRQDWGPRKIGTE